MTSFPTLLGNGGHQTATSGQTYSGTYYSNVGLGRCAMMTTGFTTESYVQQTIRVPGTISYLSWGVDFPFGGLHNTTLTLTLRKNSLNSALAVSIGPAVTGWVTDSTDSVSVSSGDRLAFAANTGAGNPSYTGSFYCVSARCDSTDTTILSAQMIAVVGSTLTTISPSSTTQKFVNFIGIVDLLGLDPTESREQFKCLTAGKWQNMACHFETNGFDVTTLISNRINGNDGSMAIFIPANTSGYFEDTTDSDSVNAADLLDYGFLASEPPGNESGSLTLDWIGAHFVATNAALSMIGGSAGPTSDISSGQTRYSSLFGGGDPGSDPHRATGLFPFALTASQYTNDIYSVDNVNATATFTLLKNGSASALTISTTSGIGNNTGYFTDTTHRVAFAVGDTCANQIVGTSDTSTWANAGLLLDTSNN